MKFLDQATLSHLSSLLNGIDGGDTIVFGRLEAYACKNVGSDKELFRRLNKQYELLSKSPEYHYELSVSPFGPLSLSTSRRTFISLISTLNASFPDYDFSGVKPEQFRKEVDIHMVVNYINTIFASVIKEHFESFSSKLWGALDEEIRLRECAIYCYIPDPDADPFCEEGNIWCFNYFFFNKKMKKLVFLSCRAVSKMVDDDMAGSEEDNGWGWSVGEHMVADMEF